MGLGTSINLFSDLPDNVPEYASHTEALAALGSGEFFRWSEVNTDGVTSPSGSQLGVTQIDINHGSFIYTWGNTTINFNN